MCGPSGCPHWVVSRRGSEPLLSPARVGVQDALAASGSDEPHGFRVYRAGPTPTIGDLKGHLRGRKSFVASFDFVHSLNAEGSERARLSAEVLVKQGLFVASCPNSRVKMRQIRFRARTSGGRTGARVCRAHRGSVGRCPGEKLLQRASLRWGAGVHQNIVRRSVSSGIEEPGTASGEPKACTHTHTHDIAGRVRDAVQIGGLDVGDVVRPNSWARAGHTSRKDKRATHTHTHTLGLRRQRHAALFAHLTQMSGCGPEEPRQDLGTRRLGPARPSPEGQRWRPASSGAWKSTRRSSPG